MVKIPNRTIKQASWNLWVAKIQFGWYIRCLAVINVHVGHTKYWLSNISWNWFCYQHAFSAIYQNYFWKFTLFADAILLQIL